MRSFFEVRNRFFMEGLILVEIREGRIWILIREGSCCFGGSDPEPKFI